MRNDEPTFEQLRRFDLSLLRIRARVTPRCAANSAGFTISVAHFDLVRAGIALYGFPRFQEGRSATSHACAQ
jgi:alanine racemase